MNLLATLFCGAAAGWIAGKVMHSSHGLIMNIILGLIGSSNGSYSNLLSGTQAGRIATFGRYAGQLAAEGQD